MNMQTGAIIIVAVMLFMLAASGTSLFSPFTATTTPPSNSESVRSSAEYNIRDEVVISSPARNTRTQSTRLSNEEIEDRLAELYDDIDELEKKLQEQQLREPASPYRNFVALQRGNYSSTDYKREYLTLTAKQNNTEGVPISDWYLESYVTKERAALPNGARLLKTQWARNDAPMMLLPGERAYLLTTESPLNVSFHENECTGYLRNEIDVYPSLRRSCPSPMSEMLDYGKIKLDDDACYDFVERLSSCTTIDVDAAREAGVGSSCRRFVETHLNYNSCVANHENEPHFDDVGSWFLYLGRDEKLWRTEREIIRLMDEEDRVVAVLSY